MEIELTCAKCGATLEDRMEHGKVLVEPCDCLTGDNFAYYPEDHPDPAEMRARNSVRGWRI